MVQEGWSCNVLPTGQVFITPYELRGDLFVRLSDIMAEKNNSLAKGEAIST